MANKGEFFFKGPDFNFDFAINDAFIFNLYSYRILVFKIDSPSGHSATTEALKIALQKVVERCPPLGGVVVSTENKLGQQHGWKEVLPGPGIKLVVRDLREKLDYQDLEDKDFPPEAFKCEETVPISPAPIMEGKAPGSVFQYTWIKGGALLSVGIDHPITDGNGMNLIMSMIAEECKQVSSGADKNGTPQKKIIGTDRSIVRALEGKNYTKAEDHQSYTFLDTPPSHEEEQDGPEPNIPMFMFQITPSKLFDLKQAANTLNSRVSTHDAICALTWRSVMLSRYKAGTITNLDEEVELHIPTDVRRFIGLETDYVGNAVYFLSCKIILSQLLEPTSLPKVATMIRSALESRSRELIAGYHSLVKSLPDLGQVIIRGIEHIHTTAFCIGTSWKADQMYGADWGNAFGPVMRFRSPDVGFFGVFKGLNFICPRVQGEGPAEFQTWLEPEGWEALKRDELFGRFCERICV
jgi:hypothetical protein